MTVLGAWDPFIDWAAGQGDAAFDGALDEARLGPPVPRRYLTQGEEIVSTIEHLGTLRNPCI